jgi:hypothetical protein
MRDIRIHDTYQAPEFVTRFGSAGAETRVPLGRPLAPLRHPGPRQAESGTASQMIMRDVEPSSDTGTAETARASQTFRSTDPEKIANIVYRMMLRDLAVERERRR